MLAERFRLTADDVTDAQKDNFVLLRKLLGEKGYVFFPPKKEWQHFSDLDMLVFKKKAAQVASAPVLIYPGRTGEIFMRPWSGECQKLVISEVRSALPRRHLRGLKLRQARRPLIGDWRDYLSEESLEEARLLDLGV